MTSPPYWGLRVYDGEQQQVWGGDASCQHEWRANVRQAERYTGKRKWQHIGYEAQAAGTRVRDVDPNAWGHPKKSDCMTCATCGAWLGALGLEPNIEMYVEHMVAVFREVRRVLRRDGTLWLNLGDCYNAFNGGAGPSSSLSKTQSSQRPQLPSGYGLRDSALKVKDLVGMPWRVAFALQRDGWWLRSDIVWAKSNPMPESIKDRPTRAHEFLFLFAKSRRYYYDADAIREPHKPDSHNHDPNRFPGRQVFEGKKSRSYASHGGKPHRVMAVRGWAVGGRNKRSVWFLPTAPYRGAHFATFPPRLVEPCILAGTSPRICRACGAPWTRIATRRLIPGPRAARTFIVDTRDAQGAFRNDQGSRRARDGHKSGYITSVSTAGWRPTCSHGSGATRSIVLDPFAGSGTTGVVAQSLGRRAVLVDLAYQALAAERIHRDRMSLAPSQEVG